MIKKLILITLLGISFLAGSVLAAPLPAISNANCVFYFNFDQMSTTYGDGLFYGGNANVAPLDNKCGTQDGNLMVPYRIIPVHTTGGTTTDLNWRKTDGTGTTTWNMIKANAGVFDKGIYFDTGDTNMANFAVINNTFLGENDEMSIAFWLRVDETLAGPLFEIWDAGIYERRTRIQAEIDSSTGRIEINSWAGLEAYSSNNLITDEDFHFVVITFDDTNNDWYIYLDGQDVTDVNTYNQGSAALEIDNWDLTANRLGFNINRDYRDISSSAGSGYNSYSDMPQYLAYSYVTYTDGPIIQLDEISMYNVRLTQSEINQMYNDGVGRRWLELYGGTDDGIDLSDGLKLYYDMDSVSNTLQDDKTGNNYDLQLDNSPIQTTGKINYARDFDGSTQLGRPINITRNSGLIAGNFETALAPSGSTISTAWAFWAYPNTPSSTDSLLGWYRPPRSNNNAIGVEAYQCRNGEWNLFYRWEYGTGVHGDGGPSCDANVFQHIVWVWDKENFKIYKNGILARSFHEDNVPYYGSSYPYTSCLTGSTDAAKEIEIGLGTNLNCQYPHVPSSSYDFFNGIIDEVAFYYNDSDILNHHEVKCLYNSGLGYTYLAITGNPTCTGSTSGSGSGTNVTDGIVTNTGNIYYWNVGYPNQVTGDITYNSVTKMINYTWYDGGAATDYGRLEVYIWNGTTKQLIHGANGGTDSGTLLFNYTAYADYSFIAHGFISDVTRTYVTNGLIWVDTLTRGSTPLNPDDFGNDGLFWSAIIIGSLMLFGIWNPPVAVGLGLFGLYITSVLGIISLGSTALWSIILMAIIVMWRIRA